MKIRRATAADAVTIANFNAAMARETERLELDRERLLMGVKAVLEDGSKGVYWVAEVDGEMAGQLMLTFEWSDWRNGCFWWIQSVYVDPAHRGRGIYRALYDHVFRLAKEDAGVCGLRLYVDGHNRRAQQVYERQGMRRTAYLLYETDFVLK